MPATRNVQIRLDSAVFERYSDNAQAKEMPLAAYLRLILEEGMVGHGEAMEALLAEMTALREALFDAAQSQAGASEAMLLELLILTRAKSSPQDKEMARGEVQRQKMKPWSARDADTYDAPSAPASRAPISRAPAPPPPAAPAPAAPAKRRGFLGMR